MLSQADRVVAAADVSFNTELEVIAELSRAAKRLGRHHGIVLMVELGDLREGVMPCDVENTVASILRCSNIALIGIRANLGCRSGIAPDARNMASYPPSRPHSRPSLVFRLKLYLVVTRAT